MELKGPIELNDALDLYFMSLIDKNASHKTILCYQSDLKRFQQSIHAQLGPEVLVQDISLAPIKRFLSDFEDGDRSLCTVNRMKTSISRFFSYLVEGDYIKWRPFDSLESKLVPPKPAQALEQPERKRLAKVARTRKDVCLLMALFLDRGLTDLEAVKLDVADVKGKDILHISGKRTFERSLPVGEKSGIRIIIDGWLKERERLLSRIRNNSTLKTTRIDHQALFISRNGQRRSTNAVQVLLRKCFKRANLKWLTIRKLRFAFGKRMAARFPSQIVEAALGRHIYFSRMVSLPPVPQKEVLDAIAELDRSSPTVKKT